ncbi:tripartite tricarboxylate transporter permease [Salibacterium aidingense]|uniref:tripartite tricarboxylate transporter permease n=1 Tax=Salibacterium aidingense TaxID=384933 RepID=UPI0004140419|nr:tripartite tricarboxylate transporter permease [Salibacterium aidingense]
MADLLMNSFVSIFQLDNILFIFLGVATGIIFGSLPGLTATVGVALMLPLTFGLPPTTGMLLLLAVYCGGIYGGSISAILISAPGTPASAATVLDGYHLAKQGKAGIALRMALFASVTAGIFSALILLMIGPQIARFALNFGPAEFFALALFGLTMIASVSGKSIIKGVIMGFLGLYVSTIGIDPIDGIPRVSFNNQYLMGGISLIPALVGLFAISEIMKRAQTAHLPRDEQNKYEDAKLPFSTAKKYIKTILKSSGIGTFVGSIPGTGAAIASFLSYNEAHRSAENKKAFGKGSVEGVAAAEAGNNGVTGATLIPLLTLGIPGDTVTAVMLGALMMQGLTPGPQLFTDYPEVVYSIMIGLLFVNIVLFIQGQWAIRLFVKVTAVPVNVLLPILLSLCFIGAYGVNNTLFDVKLMMVFGLIGYFMPKLGFPITPMLLGIVLGPIAENSFRQALLLSGGNWMIFLTKPIAAIFILLAVFSFLLPLLKPYFTNKVPIEGEEEDVLK